MCAVVCLRPSLFVVLDVLLRVWCVGVGGALFFFFVFFFSLFVPSFFSSSKNWIGKNYLRES